MTGWVAHDVGASPLPCQLMEVVISAEPTGDRRARLRLRYDRLAASKQKSPLSALVARFKEIEGGDLGLLISLELFTTIIPLMIIGFAFMSGFAETASPGTIVVENFGISGPLGEQVSQAFGSSAELRSTWSFIGVAGFLIWGVPMSISIAGMYGKAWRREPFNRWSRLARGGTWFLLYLGMLALRQNIAFFGDPHGWRAVLLFALAQLPVWIFWSLTPLLLVRDGGRGTRFLLLAGLAGVVIDGLIIPLGSRLIFPSLLEGFTAFGPIGTAMALLTWCGVIGVGWVVTACASAVWWERSAPATTVVEAQANDDDNPATDPLDDAAVPAA